MGEEEKKPAVEEKKDEAEEDGKKGGEAPQEIVLRVFMHCEGCARKVRRCLKGFPGVEGVVTDCKTGKVIVKGEKADPVKVLERVQRKSHRQVELISPVPKPPPQEPPKPPETEMPEPPQDKIQETAVITVVLGVYMHCDACAQEIKRRILRMRGVESAEADLKSSQVTVKGVVDPKALAEYVYKRTGKHAAIIKVDPEKKDEENAKEEAQKGEEDAKENKDSGEQPVEDPKTEMKRNELYYYYPQPNQQLYHPRFVQELNAYPPQIFSDENPNACSVM